MVSSGAGISLGVVWGSLQLVDNLQDPLTLALLLLKVFTWKGGDGKEGGCLRLGYKGHLT